MALSDQVYLQFIFFTLRNSGIEIPKQVTLPGVDLLFAVSRVLFFLLAPVSLFMAAQTLEKGTRNSPSFRISYLQAAGCLLLLIWFLRYPLVALSLQNSVSFFPSISVIPDPFLLLSGFFFLGFSPPLVPIRVWELCVYTIGLFLVGTFLATGFRDPALFLVLFLLISLLTTTDPGNFLRRPAFSLFLALYFCGGLEGPVPLPLGRWCGLGVLLSVPILFFWLFFKSLFLLVLFQAMNPLVRRGLNFHEKRA